LFELIFWDSDCGGFAAATRIPKNSECGKREKASNKKQMIINFLSALKFLIFFLIFPVKQKKKTA
jgi:hypothetical protein